MIGDDFAVMGFMVFCPVDIESILFSVSNDGRQGDLLMVPGFEIFFDECVVVESDGHVFVINECFGRFEFFENILFDFGINDSGFGYTGVSDRKYLRILSINFEEFEEFQF